MFSVPLWALGILSVLALIAASYSVYTLIQKIRQHRQILDARIDELARQLQNSASGADARFDFLTSELTRGQRQRVRLELLAKTDHLLHLAALGRDTGRLDAEHARQLQDTVLRWRDEVDD